MRIGVPKEVRENEARVATTPEAISQLQKLGFDVLVEAGAGTAAKYTDEAYKEAGATILEDTKQVWADSDIILKVRAPQQHPVLNVNEADLLKEGQTFVSFMAPAQNPELLETFAAKNVTALAVEGIPRISRAQKMDCLSSMANIAGYRAVIEAAQQFGRFFTGQITAAGKIPPAKILVIGAGVAGLSAIGTAASMGAIVRAFDTRLEAKDQVESLGGEFLVLEFEDSADGSGEGGYAKTMSDEFIAAEMAMFAEQAKEVDIVITTALIPGRPAPELWTEEMVKSMKEGSVIVDLAAEMGGNCKLTEANKIVSKHGVTLIGYTDLPSRLPTQASQLYATNLRHLMTDMCPEKDGNLVVDMEDEVVRGATCVKDGKVTWPPPPPKLSAAPKAAPKAAPVAAPAPEEQKTGITGTLIGAVIAGAALLGMGSVAPADFMAHFTVFVLACFVGYMVVWNVSASLHTPLMSVTNAISSIIIIGALFQISSDNGWLAFISAFAVFITMANIVGGFAVTRRMLAMFQK